MKRILKEDLEYIAGSDLPWNNLKGSTVLVTGGNGFIGSLLVKTLDYISKKKDLNITISALVRDEEDARKTLDGCDVVFEKGDIRDLPGIAYDVNYIFHCAAVTKSKDMVQSPVEVSDVILNGTRNVMRLAVEKKAKGVVYLSSMEVYGRTAPELDTVGEEDLGYIDILNARSCYPLGKRMAENICFSYYDQYGVPVKIVRLAQIFGAGVLSGESRVFGQFARSVMSGQDIVLHTNGESYGNYCYTADAVIGLFTLLFRGESGQAYNISNEETNMTIGQMAELVAGKIAGGGIAVRYDIPEDNPYGYAPQVKMKLSSEKIRKLGWKPKYGMEEMYRRMIGDME